MLLSLAASRSATGNVSAPNVSVVNRGLLPGGARMRRCLRRCGSPRCSRLASRTTWWATPRCTPEAVLASRARVVVFPELSLTGYELDARAVAINDAALAPIVNACASHRLARPRGRSSAVRGRARRHCRAGYRRRRGVGGLPQDLARLRRTSAVPSGGRFGGARGGRLASRAGGRQGHRRRTARRRHRSARGRRVPGRAGAPAAGAAPSRRPGLWSSRRRAAHSWSSPASPGPTGGATPRPPGPPPSTRPKASLLPAPAPTVGGIARATLSLTMLIVPPRRE